MVEISLRGDMLRVDVQGLHKLWALKDRIEVPLASVRDVRRDPQAATGFWKGWRVPGTHVPGLIVAGTYYQSHQRVFYDVVRASRAIVIELEGERYDRLVVEVEHPEREVARLRTAAGRRE